MVRRVDGDVQVDGAVTAERGGQHARESGVADRGGVEQEAVLAEGLTLAERGVEVGDGGLVHAQVQHGGAVAAVRVSLDMGEVLRLRGFRDHESEGVVGLALADVGGNLPALLRMDVQVQVNDAVAAVHGGQVGLVDACRGQRHAVEVVLAVEADGVINVRLEQRPHGQGERGETVAAIDVLAEARQRVLADCREEGVESEVRVAGVETGLVRQFRCIAVMDGEMQDGGAVAAEPVREMLLVFARFGVGLAVPFETFAGRGFDNFRHRGIDGEVQGHGAVASVGGGEGLDVVAGLDVEGVVPLVTVAGGGFNVLGHRRKDVQVQDDGGIASVGGGQVGGVIALGAQLLAVEEVAAVVADGLEKLRHDGGQHGQIDDGGAVAAMNGDALVRKGLLAGFLKQFVEAVARVGGAGADGLVELHEGGLMDSQRHRHCAVTALRGG